MVTRKLVCVHERGGKRHIRKGETNRDVREGEENGKLTKKKNKKEESGNERIGGAGRVAARHTIAYEERRPGLRTQRGRVGWGVKAKKKGKGLKKTRRGGQGLGKVHSKVRQRLQSHSRRKKNNGRKRKRKRGKGENWGVV